MLRWLRDIDRGELSITFPSGGAHLVRGETAGAASVINVRRNSAIRKILARGAVGFAEAYVDGDWSTPDLLAVLDFGHQNESALARPMRATALFGLLLRIRHKLRSNTRQGARRNIAYHYDLGNTFYRLWLDETMTYSSALFERSDATLEEAQTDKYRQVIRSLDLRPSDRVLEIGCGWGGFAKFAARETGCSVTGITLSQEQVAFARRGIDEAGLADQVEIRSQDYRDVREQFDKIVSIEMFEAVGEENWPAFFRAIRSRLKRGGRAALQIITIADDRFETYRNNIDFIRRYIFPGGMLPTKSILAKQAVGAGMPMKETRSFGASYAETLRRWREAFQLREAEIGSLGFDKRFRRMWNYYLCCCEASFRAHATDVSHFLIERS